MVETNIVPLDLSGTDLDAATLAAHCRASGVLVSGVGPRRVRLVTHLDIDDAAIDRALEVLSPALAG
jgi:threonine aldolase